MTKLFFKFFTILILFFILVGCNNFKNNNQNNPTVEPGDGTNEISKGMVNQNGAKIYPKSVVGYVGDPMPYFEDGVMNVFYLPLKLKKCIREA